jgi:hypothetical protein
MQRLGHSQILAGRALEVLPILNFEEFLLGEEKCSRFTRSHDQIS